VFTVASTAEEVESSNAVMTVKPEYTIEKSPKPDIVVIPGGNISSVTHDAKMMDWLKARASDSEIVMSVCNGAVALHKAGLLEGLEITSHRSAIEYYFKREAPNQKIAENRRYVDNGKIITAAGVSAGIDAALHVVERLLGPEAANNTADYMEYTRPREAASASR
jgi:transcriptional regulator GlxA family with amidase domain